MGNMSREEYIEMITEAIKAADLRSLILIWTFIDHLVIR